MANEHFFITGALGCIGAWVVRNLIREGVAVTVFDMATDPHRLRLIMEEDELAAVRFVRGDITDLEAVAREVEIARITHIVHLAGLQVPMCKANPSLGARVNVEGTVNIFEAAKRAGIRHVVYASSIAVYGLSDEYGEEPLAHDAPPHPRSLYGVYKQANEGTARVYWLDNGVSSMGLRPYTVYGPGRDQGLTSSPTKAMLAAAMGQPYHIPFGGQVAYQYADDVARIFIRAARVGNSGYSGADVFNMRGVVAGMDEVIAAVAKAAPDAPPTTCDPTPLPFPSETDETPLIKALGALDYIPLEQGIAETVNLFRRAIIEGRLTT
jgi:UDP-glucuronate 4-epimerase